MKIVRGAAEEGEDFLLMNSMYTVEVEMSVDVEEQTSLVLRVVFCLALWRLLVEMHYHFLKL